MTVAPGWIRRLGLMALVVAVLAGGLWYAANRTPWGHTAYVHTRTILLGSSALGASHPVKNTPGLGMAFTGPTPAVNAMLSALRVHVLQTRYLPGAWAQYGWAGWGQLTAVWVDVQLRITNTGTTPIHLQSTDIESGCMPLLQHLGEWTGPALLIPLSNQLYTVSARHLAADDAHQGAGESADRGEYLNLAPHQTKVGWITADYVTNCGSPNILLFSDDVPSFHLGGITVTFRVPIHPVGPPLQVPARLP